MSKRSTSERAPKYRRQRRPQSTDDAFVELDGERHYLGSYDSPESREAYHRLLAEWSANGRHAPTKAEDVRVVEVCAKFWEHANVYYRRPDGTPTILDRVKMTMKPLRELYGRTRAADFGPNALRAVRQTWIDANLARRTINDQTAMAKLIFKWAASHELIPGSVYHALQTVEGLRKGRSAARETDPVRPVPEQQVTAIEGHVSRQVWGLVQLQLLTGARSGELVIMRPVDLDTSGRVWTYTPTTHKTAHRGHDRTILIGPKGQGIIRSFMAGRAVDAFLFDPRDAIHEHADKAPTHRRPDQVENPRQTERTIGDRYSVESYRRAVTRACMAAGVPEWTPHRLRHNAATNLRREYGIDIAQTVLGHRLGSGITELYAEANVAKARDVIAQIG